ncbi:NAD(P)/FAD-dependent oxidoreductase [Halomonas heilongjiangensis]|uniref:D-amino-acid oxidase n=1 Tax=Halomonas heilongjiangensis TaxID=1387883 RepID=A0A2N7TFI6_9GAMM|nr:FAD-binding oxidoreductase [Halomonas heilongjiangensis]PMR66952.1 D-amino-acid oxidase [Halomonas heilongjiangensis]PXX88538.1 D-amino-acid oxidase [Halomonas heilongjiangensis]
MSPSITRIPSDEHLPSSAGVVIIGGGIVGATAAYFLAKRGHSVALIEKGYVGCEQSSRNWGWCRQQNRDARELPLSGAAMRLWGELTAEIGTDLGFRRCGLVYATDDPKQLAEWEAWLETAHQFDINTRILSPAEATSAIPSVGRKWLGGVHSVDDGKAEPAIAAPGIAEGARAHGASIHQNCAAHGLDITHGAVTGVITEQGVIRTNAVLCAAGAWASAFCRRHGIRFPQASVRQTALRTRPAPNLGEALYTRDCTLTRRLDGSYTVALSGKARLEITPQGIRYGKEFLPMFIKRLGAMEFGIGESFIHGPEGLAGWGSDKPSAFERNRVLDPAPISAAAILEQVRKRFPALANIEMAESWGGYVDCTPDAVPVISTVEGISGFVLAAGCSGHGFGLGPGIGHLAADLVANDAPCVDPGPYRLSRLLDGSKVEVGAL